MPTQQLTATVYALAQFAADSAARTITGLAVPYGGARAEKYDGSFAFSRGSIAIPDPSRVPLLLDHDPTRVVGVLLSTEDTDAGLLATFRVSSTPDGDALLQLAKDGARGGLSVGVEIDQYTTTDLDNGTRHYDVTSASLIEVSSTAFPAFGDARLTEVRLSRTAPTITREDTPVMTTSAAASAAAPAPAEASVTQITEAIAAGFASMAAPSPAPRPTSVVEEAPYRVDGSRGARSLSADIKAVLNGDNTPRQYMDAFLRETFTTSSADVAAINPARQRPDMYVDRLVSSTPCYDTLYSGPLSDGTPFIFPKFASASDLVNDHTEGEEPPGGGIAVAVGGTITPKALSGKCDVPREVIDAGGNPQVDMLIWREMTRAWYDRLEWEAAQLLLNLSGVQVKTITTGAVDTDLSAEVEGQIAALHFGAGGLRVTDMLAHANLYLPLQAARDGQGRPLYPVVGASNANGGQSASFGSLQVGPLVARPTWSLGPHYTHQAGKSYLLNRDDVHIWASAPQRIELAQTVAAVNVGIWGYVAGGATRPGSVIRLDYQSAA